MRQFHRSHLLLVTLSGFLLCLATGCQCTRLTDCAGNMVDDISDHSGCMDDAYCACFDLTRIGWSDWRACRCNRVWCRKCAEQYNCDCNRYQSVSRSSTYIPQATETILENGDLPAVPPSPEPEPAKAPSPDQIQVP